jgi:hypothetical protein
MSEIQMCDLVPTEAAVAMYQWPWSGPGSSGHCSLAGQSLLRQQARNLKREVHFLPLPASTANTPLSRDERTRLIAERLSAESERDETSQRATRLYSQNLELSAEIKNLKAREAEAQAQIKDLRADLEAATAQGLRATREAADLLEKFDRANRLLEAGPGEVEAQVRALTAENARLREVIEG